MLKAYYRSFTLALARSWKLVTFEQAHELMAMVNLAFEISVILMISLSLLFKKKGLFVWHGNMMIIAVMIPALFVISHMGPALVSVLGEAIESPDFVNILGVVHSIFGAITIFLGLWLVGMWGFVWQETRACAKRKKLMLRITVLWLVALGLGILYYPLHLSFG
jgi:uncharacterized membrane protein YozB (DUF420 family)